MEENIAVIWYDSDTNEIEPTIAKKRLLDEDLNACLTTHSDLQSCITHIESLPKMNLFFITSITCAREILPLIHQMRQIDSVFLFSNVKENFEDILVNYSKIITCSFDQKTLTELIRENIQLAQRQNLVFSFYNQHKKPTRELSKESAHFLWFQLFKNVLLNLPSNDEKAKDDLVTFLRQRYRNNNKQMRLIEEFAEKYQADDAICWYTGQPFLYRHLNKALRSEDIDQLYIFRCFIGDICRRLLHEYQVLKEYEPSVTLYRGTRMLNDEYDKLKANVGNLISMNGFLSTSLRKDVAVAFAGKSDEIRRAVVFEIQCDLSQVETVILAPIVQFSVIKNEEEVLIDIGAVFRLLSVDEQNTIILIKMEATDEGTKVARGYLEINQAELKEKNARIIWGDLLSQMGYYDKALEYFRKLQGLDEEVQEWQLQIHIGHVLFDKSLFEDAVQHYLNAAELWDKQSSEVNVSILLHISMVLIKRGNFKKALLVVLNILKIYQNDTKIEHDRIYYHDIASMLSHLGLCYLYLGDYDQAIRCFNEAYEIRETYYASDHFDNADDLGSLGIIYRMKGDCKRALHYFCHATAIYDRTLPSDHPQMPVHFVRIAQAYADQNRKDDSLQYLRKALALQRSISSDIAVDKAFTLDILSLIAFLEGDEDQTIELIQCSLEIKRTYLCEDHQCIALDLATLGNILKEKGRNDEAIAHYTEALTIYEQLEANGHPEIAIILHGLGFIYCAKKDYDIALSYYIKAQRVYEKHFTSNDPNHIRLLLSIAEVYQLKGDLSLAIDALKNCLATIQNPHPVDKLLVGRTYMMLADTYMLEGNVIAALYQYEKGLSIEVDDEIEHYVYHVGYHLLMLSCNLKSHGHLQQAQMMCKNASIIFQRLDKLNLFDLVEKVLKLSTNDYLKNGLLSFPESVQKNTFTDAPEIIEILNKAASLPSNHVEVLSARDQILHHYFSMALYQQLFMDAKQRATAIILLGSHYEKEHRKDLAQHYYALAKSLYKELVAKAVSATDSIDLNDRLNSITIRIESLTM